MTVDRLKPRTKAFGEARATGRLDGYWVDIAGSPVMIINMYGWTKANGCKESAEQGINYNVTSWSQ